ncbi:MAG: hypothetical protein LBG95_05405 [Treponema sp.]|jgi:hypothetical protein|nr:hypothetical protein [Treponema sp.]
MGFRKTSAFFAILFLLLVLRNLRAQEEADETAPVNEEAPSYFLNLQLLPGLNILNPLKMKVTNNLLLGAAVGIGYNIKGAATSSFGTINTGHVQGLQFSGVFNIANEEFDGFQSASLFNVSKGVFRGGQFAGAVNYSSGDFYGFQFSGLMNMIKGNMWGIQLAPINRRAEGDGVGIQVGLVNISESGNVIPVGLVNKVKNGMKHFFVHMDDSTFLNLGYRSGSRIFYSHSSYGFGGGILPGREGDNLIMSRGGFGLEFPINNFFIDIDLSRGNIKKLNDLTVKDIFVFIFGSNTSIYQIRLIAGYKFYERLGVFAGISWDYLRQNRESDPSPQDFGGVILGAVNDNRTAVKMGFFGGLQF